MRRFNKYIFLSALLFAGHGCVMLEEQEQVVEELVQMTFQATIENGLTKTGLTGSASDEHRDLIWFPGDKITIYAYEGTHNEFTNVNDEDARIANFVGQSVMRDQFYAVYPSTAVSMWWDSGRYAIINLPTKQTYSEKTFADDLNPMVATAAKGEILNFKNLCGLLVINLKGEEKVKTIRLAAYDESGNLAQTAGGFQVDFNDEDLNLSPPSQMTPTGNFIEMDCGEGVQLNPNEGTQFHFILAPGSYSKITIYVTTADDKIMVKEGRNPITIRRAEWITAGTLSYVETISVDLSERGNANCYIVPKAGMYSFETHVVGNGEHGYIENASFYPATPEISPVKAELLWEDKSDVVSGVSLENNRITFLASGLEGNAVIAAKDESDKILWSWHIWVTDQPQDQVYENSKGTFTMLDRNIGATRADRGTGEQWREGSGLQYQWGRKDPFAESKYITLNTQLSVGETIQMPTHFAAGNGQWTAQWNNNFWSTNQKTIYDPCPVGYRVAVPEVWCDFTTTGENVDRSDYIYAQGEFDHGWNFIYDGSNTAWYSANNEVNYWGRFDNYSNQARIWSAENTGNSKYLGFSYTSLYECYVYLTNFESPVYAYSVRCMKDEGHVDTSYPTVKLTSISDITSESAHVTANVTDHGISEITERGILYSTSAEITVDNATKVTSESGDGEYTTDLTGLAHSTRYYVRAYAVNERGISYSKEMSFYTPYSGSAVDLSVNGTANCYIVPPVYSTYTFDCTVKGNSMISVGTPAEAVVLWETRNDRNTINAGDVIESITLEGDKVKFLLPFEPKPGNALVAVKDANGTILWSWHIWVVDFDPVQTGNMYISGNMMMDRNLGALNATPGDAGSLGLYYQWGRKDPFVGSGNRNSEFAYTAPENAITYVEYSSINDNLDYSVQNPTVLMNASSWNDDISYWNTQKTEYDPCPQGWKVAEQAVWEGIKKDSGYSGNYAIKVSEPYSVPAAYYPTTGYMPGYIHIDEIHDCVRIWTDQNCQDWRWYYGDNYFYFPNESCDYMMAVRCMKDADYSVTTSGYDDLTATSVKVSGNIEINDMTRIEEMGFIYLEGNSTTPNILTNTGIVKVASQASGGNFTGTISGLKPSTTYSVRAYAKGGYNTKYGDVLYLTTGASVNNEDVNNGGDYEWE